MRLEDIETQIKLRSDLQASRTRVFSGNLIGEDLQLERERMAATFQRLEEFEAAHAPPPPPPLTNAAKLTRAEAAAKAKELREDPAFLNPGRLNKEGLPSMTTEAGIQRFRELVEYDARADAEKE